MSLVTIDFDDAGVFQLGQDVEEVVLHVGDLLGARVGLCGFLCAGLGEATGGQAGEDVGEVGGLGNFATGFELSVGGLLLGLAGARGLVAIWNVGIGVVVQV